MVKNGEDFVVYDAKTGEDITRSVLAQIIFEQENKEGAEPAADHVPAPADPLLRRQHADAGAALSRSLDRIAHPRAGQVPRADGAGVRRGGFGPMEEQVRRNMEMFEKTFAMFAPFARGAEPRRAEPTSRRRAASEMDELKRQLEEMQKRLDNASAARSNQRLSSPRRRRRSASVSTRPTVARRDYAATVPALAARARARPARPADNRSPSRRSNCGGRLVLHPFGDGLEAEPVRQIDQRVHEGAVVVRA